jgi:hypothetical protein
MNDALNEPLLVLCQEIGLTPPAPDARGQHVLVIDGQELRVLTLAQGRVVVLGVIGTLSSLAEKRGGSERLLADCLTVQAARLAAQAIPEVLTLEPDSGELVLWRAIAPHGLSVPVFLNVAESMLNELEFWKNWLSNA